MKKVVFVLLLMLIAVPSMAQIISVVNVNTTQVFNACTSAIQDYNLKAKPSISIGGTEYVRGVDYDAKVFAFVIEGNRTINNATCTDTIFSPFDSIFRNSVPMTFINNGLYVDNFQFNSSMPLGVYPVSVSCLFPIIRERNNATVFSLIQGTNPSGTLNDTRVEDDVNLRLTESLLITRRVIAEFNFTTINLTNSTSLQVLYQGQWFGGGTSETVNISVFNYSSNSFYGFPNTIPDNNQQVSVSNSFPFPLSDFVVNNTARIRLEDSNNPADLANNNFDIDLLVIDNVRNMPLQVNQLTGINEIHIRERDFNATFILDTLTSDKETTILSPTTQAAGVAFAQADSQVLTSVCTANNTLKTSVDKIVCVGNDCRTVQQNSTVTCPFGCNSNEYPNRCNTSQRQNDTNFFILAAIAILSVVVVLYWAQRRR